MICHCDIVESLWWCNDSAFRHQKLLSRAHTRSCWLRTNGTLAMRAVVSWGPAVSREASRKSNRGKRDGSISPSRQLMTCPQVNIIACSRVIDALIIEIFSSKARRARRYVFRFENCLQFYIWTRKKKLRANQNVGFLK